MYICQKVRKIFIKKNNMKISVFSIIISLVLVSGSLFGQMSKSQHKKALELERMEKNQWMTNPEASPLTASQQQNFNELSYYKVNFDYVVPADFTKSENQEKETLSLSNGGTIELMKYGQVSFEIDGKTYSLDVFYNNGLAEFSDQSNALFVLFKDKSNMEETFSGGRYLPVEINERGQSYIDFNKAMNPFAAYNSSSSYIIPPGGNELPKVMTVGERRYEHR